MLYYMPHFTILHTGSSWTLGWFVEADVEDDGFLIKHDWVKTVCPLDNIMIGSGDDYRPNVCLDLLVPCRVR